MFVRAISLAGLLGFCLLAGCSSGSEARRVDAPPPLKFQNFQRLGDEFAWTYADMQDLIFGVDYYDHIEGRFGSAPVYP